MESSRADDWHFIALQFTASMSDEQKSSLTTLLQRLEMVPDLANILLELMNPRSAALFRFHEPPR
jgi:hypothetical protein